MHKDPLMKVREPLLLPQYVEEEGQSVCATSFSIINSDRVTETLIKLH